jgi:hypothetical protein
MSFLETSINSSKIEILFFHASYIIMLAYIKMLSGAHMFSIPNFFMETLEYFAAGSDAVKEYLTKFSMVKRHETVM